MKRKYDGILEDRLIRRELELGDTYCTTRSIYGDRRFMKDLDIVNELKGHTGCVNALSWSQSGRLLASGSDDKMINIHRYHPEHSTDQFNLATTIDTGHRRNIFSVKFMPHSSENKIVSCAGDNQVRIFDLERSGSYLPDGSHQTLSTTSTSAKVFQSHSSSVKRIVTEASPFYFLTCSEDGEVRQWDIRQPESAYPLGKSYWGGGGDDDVPPPLISYRDYNISLYTLSCSAAQPYYIALGGTHLHCFLHDRRMLGRDKLRERGGAFSPSYCSDSELDAISQATRCVRKFAPHGQPTMTRTASSQLTACKLGNYNPNELIVSWSCDNIYSFDIRRDDADTVKTFTTNASKTSSKSRKRKRASNLSRGGLSEEGDIRAQSRSRTLSSEPPGDASRYALRVQLRDGSSREIPIGEDNSDGGAPEASANEPATKDDGTILAESVYTLQRSLVEGKFADGQNRDWRAENADDREKTEMAALAQIAPIFEVVDENVRHWHYPTNPTGSEVHFQQRMRHHRNRIWRFVQCAGTLVRVLLRMSTHTFDPDLRDALKYFDMVRPAPREASMLLDSHEQFCYDFIKAVLLWLDSGVGAVVREFQADPANRNHYARRQPISKDAELDALENELFPYLRKLASNRAVVHCDKNEDGIRHPSFESEVMAVDGLEKAMKIPFADLVGDDESRGFKTEHGIPSQQGRETALLFWGTGVCRALLESAVKGMDFNFVETAFDGRLANLDLLRDLKARNQAANGETPEWLVDLGEQLASRLEGQEEGQDDGEDEHDHVREDSDDGRDEEDSDDDGDDDSEDDDEPTRLPFRPGSDYKVRARAGKDVPCTTHTRLYKGHCNVETTKDVNFYGLRDEYVMSGSDCGHLFIWDKNTSEIVQVLEGDGEVVNVIQGHPQEPMIACSGIDSTIKIFSPDAYARRNAALAIGVEEADPSNFSSILGFSRRRGGNDSEASIDNREGIEGEYEGHVRPEKGLRSRQSLQKVYELTTQNEMRSSRGMDSTFINTSVVQIMLQRIRANPAAHGIDLDDLDSPDCATM